MVPAGTVERRLRRHPGGRPPATSQAAAYGEADSGSASREHGFTGGYTIVKDYVRTATLRGREMFVPLTHAAGEAQVDFGEALAVIAGVERKARYLVMDLPHSITASWCVSGGDHRGVSGRSRQGTGTIGFSAAPSFASNTSTYQTRATLSWWSAQLCAGTRDCVRTGVRHGVHRDCRSYGLADDRRLRRSLPWRPCTAIVNYTFGFQRQWTTNLTTSITYVGSQGHFLFATGRIPGEYFADQLDPRYLSLGSCLTTKVSSLATTTNARRNSLTAVQ